MGIPKILIVEDDVSLAKHTSSLLERIGYSIVSIQTSGDDAVRAAVEQMPDIILMDISIDGNNDGIQTATAIRLQRDIPIIFLTASTDDSTLQRAKSTEPYGFIIKPFNKHELRAAIELALYKHDVQKKLREHEHWLATVTNCIGDAVVGTDAGGYIRLFNAVAEQLTGYSAADAMGRPVEEIVKYSCGAETVPLPLPEPGVTQHLGADAELRRRTGEQIPVEGNVSLIGGSTSANGGIVLVFRDISKRKAAEEQLQQSEKRYKSVVLQSPDSIFLVELDTLRIVEANAAMARLFGYRENEMIGVSLYDMVAHEREEIDRNLQRVLNEGLCDLGERLYRRSDGSLVDVDVTANLVSYSGKTLLCIVSRDITERKQYEREIRENEARFRALYEQAPVMMQSVDKDGIIRNVNYQWLAVMGYEREEVIGRSVLAMMPDEYAVRVQSDASLAFWSQGCIEDMSYQFIRKDGTLIDIRLNCTEAPDPVHKRISLAVLQDITEQKRAEEELIRSQKKYAELIRNVPIAIMRFLIDENKYEFVNNAFERQSGYSLEEVERLDEFQLVEMIHEKDRYRVFSSFRNWQKDGYQDVQHLTYRIINKQGNVVWLDSYMYADVNEYGQPVALNQICVDITGLKRAEKALSDTLREDFRRTVQNLQNLVIKLYRLPEGGYAYSLREGKLAGELTTNSVRNRTPFAIYGDAHDALVRPHIMRAFEGQSITFEMELDGKWFFYLLEPVIENGIVEEVVGSAVDITQQKSTERLLRDSEQKFRVLVENLPIAIVQSRLLPDGELQTQYVNTQYEQQTGYSAAEQLAMTSQERLELYHPDDRSALLQKWEGWQQPQTEPGAQQLFRFRHKSGEYRWFNNYAIRYPIGGGEFAVIEALLDVTDQKLGQERLRRLASFPEQDPSPIIEIDLNGTICYVNPKAKSVFPDIEEQRLAHPVLEWVWANIPTLLLQPDGVLSRELELGGEVYEQVALYLPEVALIRIFCYAITERKHAEEQLLKALAKERELSSLKTRFVTTVSHEFRTPLTGILMSAEILERYGERMSGEDRVAEVDKIKKRVHELTDLMNDFLLQSSAESLRTTFRPVPVNLAKVCTEVVSEHLPAASADYVPLQWAIEPDVPNVQGDPKLLRLVVQNLVSNAVKFSVEHSVVQISLSHEKDFVVLSVSDTGIGIPADEVESLFTPFYRASNAARIPGTGIGLSIVREFIELHNGSIRVQSEHGRGSVFTVAIPVNPMQWTNDRVL